MADLRERLSGVLRDLEQRLSRPERPGAPGGAGQVGRPRPSRRMTPGVARAFADLELPADATLEEARAAWRRLVGRYHPDRFSGDARKTAVATRVTAKLTAAWETVKGHLELQGR